MRKGTTKIYDININHNNQKLRQKSEICLQHTKHSNFHTHVLTHIQNSFITGKDCSAKSSIIGKTPGTEKFSDLF